MQQDLQDRADALMDNGLAPTDPRVKFATDLKREIGSAA